MVGRSCYIDSWNKERFVEKTSQNLLFSSVVSYTLRYVCVWILYFVSLSPEKDTYRAPNMCVFSRVQKISQDWRIKDAPWSVYPLACSVTLWSFSGWDKVYNSFALLKLCRVASQHLILTDDNRFLWTCRGVSPLKLKLHKLCPKKMHCKSQTCVWITFTGLVYYYYSQGRQ